MPPLDRYSTHLLALAMTVISAVKLTIEFPMFDVASTSLRTSLISRVVRGKPQPIHEKKVRALDEVTFSVDKGETVGLLGRNGSGKSTLLRTLAGVYSPVSGSVTVAGERTAIIDLVNGMDVNATGYDNIVLRGLALGMSLSEIRSARAEICEFSGLDTALRRPIRTYSSGMLLRLAFAVSTAVPRDVVLIDEVVGAGDSLFITRAAERLTRYIQASGTLVLASHSDQALRQFCERGIVLMGGHLVFDGPIEDAIRLYGESCRD